jgi:protein TonB
MNASTPTTATPAPEPQRPAATTGSSTAWLGSQSIFDRRDENAFKRAAGATGVTLAFYAIVLTLLLIGGITVSKQIINPQEEMPKFVYLNDPGPGGGGGGSPAPAPPKPMEVPKHKAPDPIPEPVVTPPPPPPTPTLNAPIETSLANVLQATGSNSVSLASYGGGGSGGGIGSGRGNGVGPGTGGGFGGGAFRPGNGILPPSLIHQVEPKYTSDAMRAKVQGDVELEAVILPNGTVGDVHITKSLDDKFGLDQEAIKAAKQWTFRPGTDRDGKAQPVIVTLILSFRLH